VPFGALHGEGFAPLAKFYRVRAALSAAHLMRVPSAPASAPGAVFAVAAAGPLRV
jgi:hypothetical protein